MSVLGSFIKDDNSKIYSSGPLPLTDFQIDGGTYFPTLDLLRLGLARTGYVFKEQYFVVENFEHIDRAAMETSLESANESFTQLNNTFCLIAKTKLEMVRICFRWMTYMDSKLRLIGEEILNKIIVQPNSPLAIMKDVADDQISHTSVFQMLMNAADIPSVEIKGVVKGVNYKLGFHINEDEHFGSWIAVQIDDSWRLLDPSWACRALEGHTSSDWTQLSEVDSLGSKQSEKSGAIVTTLNESYFLTDPHIFVCNHLPRDSQWQLLPKPVTLTEFEQMPSINGPDMSKQGLKLVSHIKGVFVISESSLSDHEKEKNLHVKDASDNVLEFEDNSDFSNYSCNLQIDSSILAKEESLNIIKYRARDYGIKSYVMIAHNICQHRVRIYLQPPVKGKYKLEVYGTLNNSGSFVHLVSYVFHCQGDSDVIPLPPNKLSEWGPGGRCLNAGLQPLSHPDAMIEAATGEVTIRMRILQDGLSCLPQLVNLLNQQMPKCVIHWKEDNDTVANFKVRVPEPGLYTLSIATRPSENSQSINYVFCCDYLIDAQQAANYPTDYFAEKINSRLGPTDGVNDLGITLISPLTFYLDCTEKEIQLLWRISQPLDLMLNFFMQDSDGLHDFTEFSSLSVESNTIYFDLRFPMNGYFVLLIFGKLKSTMGSNMPLLYKYLIHVVDKPFFDAPKFPVKTDEFLNLQFQVIEPNRYVLNPGNSDFKLSTLVRVADVAVINNDGKWNHLKLNGNIWQDQVDCGDHGNVRVCVKQEENSPNYRKILDFKIRNETDSIEDDKLLTRALDKYKKYYKNAKDYAISAENEVITSSTNNELIADDLEMTEIELSRAEMSIKDCPVETVETDQKLKSHITKSVALQLRCKLVNMRLKSGARYGQRPVLEQALEEYKTLNLEEIDPDSKKAALTAQKILRELVYIDEINQELPCARGKLNNETLKILVENIKKDELSHEPNLINLLAKVNDIIQHISEIQDLVKSIKLADSKEFEEMIQSKYFPNQIAHPVLISTLLLLGVYEGRSRNWFQLADLFNPFDNIVDKISHFEPEHVHPEIAARAKDICFTLCNQTILECNSTLHLLFLWNLAVLKQIEETCKNTRDFKPALLARQRKLLGVSEQEEADLMHDVEKFESQDSNSVEIKMEEEISAKIVQLELKVDLIDHGNAEKNDLEREKERLDQQSDKENAVVQENENSEKISTRIDVLETNAASTGDGNSASIDHGNAEKNDLEREKQHFDQQSDKENAVVQENENREDNCTKIDVLESNAASTGDGNSASIDHGNAEKNDLEIEKQRLDQHSSNENAVVQENENSEEISTRIDVLESNAVSFGDGNSASIDHGNAEKNDLEKGKQRLDQHSSNENAVVQENKNSEDNCAKIDALESNAASIGDGNSASIDHGNAEKNDLERGKQLLDQHSSNENAVVQENENSEEISTRIDELESNAASIGDGNSASIDHGNAEKNDLEREKQHFDQQSDKENAVVQENENSEEISTKIDVLESQVASVDDENAERASENYKHHNSVEDCVDVLKFLDCDKYENKPNNKDKDLEELVDLINEEFIETKHNNGVESAIEYIDRLIKDEELQRGDKEIKTSDDENKEFLLHNKNQSSFEEELLEFMTKQRVVTQNCSTQTISETEGSNDLIKMALSFLFGLLFGKFFF